MYQQNHRQTDDKFQMFGLVVEAVHAHKGPQTAAQNGNKEEVFLRDALLLLKGSLFIAAHDQESGNVEKQVIQLFASHYTPTDAALIPTGEIASVDGTPMDLRQPIAIGARIDEDFHALNGPGGYDHNWVIDGAAGEFRIGAAAYSPESGIAMTMYTDRPAVQFYTGNGLGMGIIGKEGAQYVKRSGFCIETQTFPDAPNHDNFPTALLRAGEKFYSKTSYKFDIR